MIWARCLVLVACFVVVNGQTTCQDIDGKVHSKVLQVLVACLVVVNGQTTCQDIDTSACQLMAQQQTDLCSNTAVAQSACKRFCKLCLLECYHCKDTLTDPSQCNTTQVCQQGEVCMKKELKSIVDGHHEYQMTCESQAACDGNGLSISFVGKRGLRARDISVTCCSDDLCNYPQMMTTTSFMTTTTMLPHAGCMKDVIFIVDESRSMERFEDLVKYFLTDTVSQLQIGNTASLVSMATFASSVVDRWDLDSYSNKQDVISAINRLQFKGGSGDNTVAMSYLVNKATTAKAGDRPNVPDAIILLTDDTSHGAFQTTLLANALSHKSNDIITIGIGQAATSSEIDKIATDTGHAFHLRSATALKTLSGRIASLICQ